MADDKKQPAGVTDHTHHGKHEGHGEHEHPVEKIPTKPFDPEHIAHSAIMYAIPSTDGKGQVMAIKDARELILFLSQNYDIHAGLVPRSVAARSNINQPRIIISVGHRKKANIPDLRGKLFFGLNFQKSGDNLTIDDRLIEFISHNRLTDEFDFGMVERTTLMTPQKMISCTQCHTSKEPFPLRFPYHDTNYNPALTAELIAALFTADDGSETEKNKKNREILRQLKADMEEAEKAENPSTKFHELLDKHFGTGSKQPLTYDGVRIVDQLGRKSAIAEFDRETRLLPDRKAIGKHLQQIAPSLSSQLIALSLKHTLASDLDDILSEKDKQDPKAHEAATTFGNELRNTLAFIHQTHPIALMTQPRVGIVANFLKQDLDTTEKTSRLDVRRIPDIKEVFAQNPIQQNVPSFADEIGLAVNMGKIDVPTLLDQTAAALHKDKVAAAHLLVDVLKSDRLDTLVADGKLPTRDNVMKALLKGMEEEADKQYHVIIKFNEADYIFNFPALPARGNPMLSIPGALSGGALNLTPAQVHCDTCHGGPTPPRHPIPTIGQGWQDLYHINPELAKSLFKKSYKRIEDGEMPDGIDLPPPEIQRLLNWMKGDQKIPADLRALLPKEKKATIDPQPPAKNTAAPAPSDVHHHK